MQAADLVPIVEPELLIDGDHSIQTFADTSARVIAACVAALWRQPGLALEAVLLKPQMCIAGADFQGEKPSPETVAERTLHVMRRCAAWSTDLGVSPTAPNGRVGTTDAAVYPARVVPPAFPGIFFLSGGQSESEATVNLNALNQLALQSSSAPWALSFSFGRALQARPIPARDVNYPTA